MDDFAKTLITWHKKHGRHDLPWQKDRTPYRVWISEIMLQQTQVSTVIPYFNNFMEAFPGLKNLADADIDQVLHLWTGLGYYARARNMHKAAVIIRDEHDGEFPGDIEDITSLPGIGRSTAGAILSLSMNKAEPILDGNVKRVLSRYHGIHGWPGKKQVENELWDMAAEHTPIKDVATYTQAIMDLGASLCSRTKPDCEHCPFSKDCVANAESIQHLLPGKKPKKTIPVKQARFAIVENDAGEVLLKRRPPSGIWGGLWGFPQCELEEDLETWLRENHNVDAELLQHEPQLRHTFSHFHLDISPSRLKLRKRQPGVEDKSELCWYKPSGKQQLGMAAPVKKLMDDLYTNNAGEK